MTSVFERIRKLDRALLVCHSPIDETVGVENAAQIFKAAKHPKSYLSLDRADHLLSDSSDSFYVGAMIAAWAAKYLDAPPAQDSLEPQVPKGVFVRTGTEHWRTEIRANRHALIADEPIAAGGADLGPTPYDLLVAGLGACTSMTLRMYAEHKKWPLQDVEVELHHRKIHAKDCSDCETKTGKIDKIERKITLHGPLDDQQRQRLLQIADRCPVHRTLHSEIKVETTLKS